MFDRSLTLGTVPLTLFVALFAASAVLGSTFSYDPALVGSSLSAILVSAVLYAVVAYGFAARRLADVLCGALLIAGGGFALAFIGQFRYYDYPETPSFILSLGSATTLLPNLHLGYLHPNAAATFLEAVIPLGAALAVGGRNRAVRIASALVTLVMLYALFLSFSRGAYIGLGVTVVIFLAALALSRLPRGLAVGLGVVMLAALAGGVVFLFTVDPATLPGFLGSRLALYRNSLYLALDYAFTGIGLGDTFAMIYSRYGLLIQVPFLTYAHSLPLSVWLSQGLLGLIALVGIVITFYGFTASIMRTAMPPAAFHGAWLGVTATLVHGLFDARQYTESPWIMPMLFVMMGLTLAYGQVAMNEEGVLPEVSLRRWAAYTAGLLVVALGLGLLAKDTLAAAWYTNQGALAEARGELSPDLSDQERSSLYVKAQDWYRQALESDPAYSPAGRRLGNLYVGRGNYEGAVPLLEAAHSAESANPAAIKGLGLAYVWVGQTEEAAQVLAALPADADMENELYTWGYYRKDTLGDPLLAAYAWETAQLLGGSANGDVWSSVGDLYHEAGHAARARAAYDHALAADPQHAGAQAGVAALEG